MSAPELSTTGAGEPPWGFPHLLVADDLVVEGRLGGAYLAICGALVSTSNLPPSACPEDCEGDCYLYCPQCVRHALQHVAAYPNNGEAEPDPGPPNYFVSVCGHLRVVDNQGHIEPCPCNTDPSTELPHSGLPAPDSRPDPTP